MFKFALVFLFQLAFALNPALSPTQDRCKDQDDCEKGKICRDRGDQIKVCMGRGVHGDFCQSTSDCLFGGSCRKLDDGFRRCMAEGEKGQPCSNSGDCKDKLKCDGPIKSLHTCQ